MSRAPGSLATILATYRLPLVVCAIGVLASLFAFFVLMSVEGDRARAAFESDARVIASALEQQERAVANEVAQVRRALDFGLDLDSIARLFGDVASISERYGLLEMSLIDASGESRVIFRERAPAGRVAAGPEAQDNLSELEARPVELTADMGDGIQLQMRVRLGAFIPETSEDVALLLLRAPNAPDLTPPEIHVPYQITWEGRRAFEGVALLIAPAGARAIALPALPTTFLVFGLVSTVLLFFIGQSEAQKSFQIQSEVEEKTRDLEHSRDIIARKNEELTHFAAHASHDLQSPLSGIRGLATLLERASDTLEPEQRTYVSQIASASKNAQEFVRDLLDYTTAGREGLQYETINKQQVAEAVETALRAPMGDTGAVIEWAWDAMPYADPFQFTRLVTNLISNAIKYCRERAPHIHVSSREDAGHVVIDIQDNGIGIAEEHLGSIFGTFRRLHGDQEFSGHGIGLSMCQKVMDMHNGRIEVESKVGEGSTFSLFFPKPEA